MQSDVCVCVWTLVELHIRTLRILLLLLDWGHPRVGDLNQCKVMFVWALGWSFRTLEDIAVNFPLRSPQGRESQSMCVMGIGVELRSTLSQLAKFKQDACVGTLRTYGWVHWGHQLGGGSI